MKSGGFGLISWAKPINPPSFKIWLLCCRLTRVLSVLDDPGEFRRGDRRLLSDIHSFPRGRNALRLLWIETIVDAYGERKTGMRPAVVAPCSSRGGKKTNALTNFRTSIGFPPLAGDNARLCDGKKKRQSFTITGDVPETSFGHDWRDFIIESGGKKSPFEAGRSSGEGDCLFASVSGTTRAGGSGDVHQLLFAIIIYCVAESIISGRFFNVVSARQHVNAIVCVCVYTKRKGCWLIIRAAEKTRSHKTGVGVAEGWKPWKLKGLQLPTERVSPVLSPTRPPPPLCASAHHSKLSQPCGGPRARVRGVFNERRNPGRIDGLKYNTVKLMTRVWRETVARTALVVFGLLGAERGPGYGQAR